MKTVSDILNEQVCHHCGDTCRDHTLVFNDKAFCCNGCYTVYSILHKHHLDEYYCLTTNPGLSLKSINKKDWSFVDTAEYRNKIITFQDENIYKAVFYLPQIHCSSCLWLLEHLQQINSDILQSNVQFVDKLLYVTARTNQISIADIASLLASIGYEPHVDRVNSTSNATNTEVSAVSIGIVGFCFANIMILSFPEYLGLTITSDFVLNQYFRWICLIISIPVFYISIRIFFKKAYVALQYKFVNIDAPVSLAILVTFIRSVYEIVTITGQGYLDSMAGIVFFMMVGRYIQDRTNKSINFEKNLTSLMPMSIKKKVGQKMSTVKVSDIKIDDVIVVKPNELVPVDGLLTSRSVKMDYSFLTGESEYSIKNTGEIIYSGGRVVDQLIELVVIKPFSQSDFVQMWNATGKDNDTPKAQWSDHISQYFSIFVLVIAGTSFAYWAANGQILMAWNSFTAVLIVACPCALLLSESFTYGFMNKIFSANGIFLKNTRLFERIIHIQDIVFDKTGTITFNHKNAVTLEMSAWSKEQKNIALSILKFSNHPLAISILDYENHRFEHYDIASYKESPGQGVEAWVQDAHYKMGNYIFTQQKEIKQSHVYVVKDGTLLALYSFNLGIKQNILDLFKKLKQYNLSVVSGDTVTKYNQLRDVIPSSVDIKLGVMPLQKMEMIQSKQEKGKKVVMIGDGLNDAGALKQADIGICVSGENFNFSPGSDIIIEEKKLPYIYEIINACKATHILILVAFVYSIIYNLIGLYFAVSGQLLPVVSAILMPLSSFGIIGIAYAGTFIISKKYLKFDM